MVTFPGCAYIWAASWGRQPHFYAVRKRPAPSETAAHQVSFSVKPHCDQPGDRVRRCLAAWGSTVCCLFSILLWPTPDRAFCVCAVTNAWPAECPGTAHGHRQEQLRPPQCRPFRCVRPNSASSMRCSRCVRTGRRAQSPCCPRGSSALRIIVVDADAVVGVEHNASPATTFLAISATVARADILRASRRKWGDWVQTLRPPCSDEASPNRINGESISTIFVTDVRLLLERDKHSTRWCRPAAGVSVTPFLPSARPPGLDPTSRGLEDGLDAVVDAEFAKQVAHVDM